MDKILRILLPLLLFSLISNSIFATVSFEGKESKELSYSSRKLEAKSQKGINNLAHAFNNAVGNQAGGVGRNVGELVKSSKDFTGNPKAMGYESTEVMRKTLNTEAEINEAALDVVENIKTLCSLEERWQVVG